MADLDAVPLAMHAAARFLHPAPENIPPGWAGPFRVQRGFAGYSRTDAGTFRLTLGGAVARHGHFPVVALCTAQAADGGSASVEWIDATTLEVTTSNGTALVDGLEVAVTVYRLPFVDVDDDGQPKALDQ